MAEANTDIDITSRILLNLYRHNLEAMTDKRITPEKNKLLYENRKALYTYIRKNIERIFKTYEDERINKRPPIAKDEYIEFSVRGDFDKADASDMTKHTDSIYVSIKKVKKTPPNSIQIIYETHCTFLFHIHKPLSLLDEDERNMIYYPHPVVHFKFNRPTYTVKPIKRVDHFEYSYYWYDIRSKKLIFIEGKEPPSKDLQGKGHSYDRYERHWDKNVPNYHPHFFPLLVWLATFEIMDFLTKPLSDADIKNIYAQTGGDYYYQKYLKYKKKFLLLKNGKN
jgi:hypothetical protein